MGIPGLFIWALLMLVFAACVVALHVAISAGLIVPWLDRKFGVKDKTATGLLVTFAIGGAVVAVPTIAGKVDMEFMCTTRWEPVIHETVAADGYFTDEYVGHGYAHFLTSRGFDYVEAGNAGGKTKFIRFTRVGEKQVERHEMDELRSRYGVRHRRYFRASGVEVSETAIYELASGRELGIASSFSYGGGVTGMLLPFFWGDRSCMSFTGPAGAKTRDAHESFLRTVLGAKR